MLGRGLAETLAQIRSGGFQQAQGRAMDEFNRQQGALAGLSSGLGSLAQARQQGQIGLGGQLVDLGTQLAQSRQADVQSGSFAPQQQGGFAPQQSAPQQQGGFSQQAPQQSAPQQQGGFAPQQ